MSTPLQTRPHPYNRARLQYRYLANNGKWVWGPASARRAPRERCPFCNAAPRFEQDEQGIVREFCNCPDWQKGIAVWWPSRANEMHRDSGAGWRRAIRAAE